MIGPHIEDLLLENNESLLLDADKVATVRTENTLLHAMLVLSSVGFSSIPVLDNKSRIKGKLSMAMIVNGVVCEEDYDWDLLEKKKVKDVMDSSFRTITEDAEFEEILHLLIDQNYLCVKDKSDVFLGIITRKTILKRVNYLTHNFERIYDVQLKKHIVDEVVKTTNASKFSKLAHDI